MFEPLESQVHQVLDLLRNLEPTADPQAGLDVVAGLESVKAAAAAAQARQVAAYHQVRQAQQQAAGRSGRELTRPVVHEVALAKRCSPSQAERFVAFADRLVEDLPHTLTALRAGATSEFRAMLLARETSWLRPEHRRQVDQLVGPRLVELGDRATESAARKEAYRLDPAGAVAQIGRAENDRRVSLRPAPDCMAQLTALLPVRQGVAVFAALHQAAETARAAGDPRGRGQLMADVLTERVIGQGAAEQVPVLVNVTVPAEALLHVGEGADHPGEVAGYGPVPAPLVRRWVSQPGAVPVWVRRLFTDPASGRIVQLETNKRLFTPSQRELVGLRDRTCATPFCNAPIKQIDHIRPAAAGGATSLDNAQGLCEACNYARQHTRYRPRAPAA